MASVTQRVKEVTQPRGGYLPISTFQKIKLEDNITLSEEENISSNLIGLVVDYMTRFLCGASKEKAFEISILGASLINEKEKCLNLLKMITGLTNESVICACKIVGYDVCFRAGTIYYKPVDDINPDSNTISNIAIMIKRSLYFFKNYGPIISDSITFEGGYTSIINSGDGDFITEDTLWDFKVTKNELKPQHTLQILVYYLMAKHSGKTIYSKINKIGFFNPRKNLIYIKSISEIDPSIINEVEYNVIGYNNSSNLDKTNQSEALLTMAEIMKRLKCTRYMVMKYYSEKDLPLIKKSNKYYISEEDLEMWIEERERMQLQQTIFSIVGIIIIIIIFIIMLYINTN